MRSIFLFLSSIFFCLQMQAQVSAKLMRYADISAQQIVFVLLKIEQLKGNVDDWYKENNFGFFAAIN